MLQDVELKKNLALILVDIICNEARREAGDVDSALPFAEGYLDKVLSVEGKKGMADVFSYSSEVLSDINKFILSRYLARNLIKNKMLADEIKS